MHHTALHVVDWSNYYGSVVWRALLSLDGQTLPQSATAASRNVCL